MSSGEKATTTIEPDDLISDGELEDANDDAFGHGSIVARLVDVVRHRDRDRAINIALYGPWGSGKSSVARQLTKAFELDAEIEFVRFDAFKYAQSSLRRHFLVEMARSLRPPPPDLQWYEWRPKRWLRRWPRRQLAYQDRLYQAVQRKHLNLTNEEGRSLVGSVCKFVLLPTVVLAVLGSVLWAWLFSSEPFLEGFGAALPDVLTLLVVPAAAGLFAIARELVPTATAMAEPSSEEQFEALFTEIVKESQRGRVVVFVDEIDRCSPLEVVETLDTIRTFLGVPPCVFIVAADQQVLEQAISEQVRQTTPDDSTNPYYSAGSAYLDKVFQYQFSLPPLLPATVSRYARQLVDGLPGVWSKVDCDEVVSVLIPTHVRSPRRVKALLNNYALTYRLAEEAGLLGPEVDPGGNRDDELAVLVCLQSEFPLFARDLARHPRLPGLLRDIQTQREGPLDDRSAHQRIDDEVDLKAPPWAPAASWQRALDYHRGTLFGDQILARQPNSGAGVTDEQPSAGVGLNTELREYLLKTSGIDGPGTDLIFMTSGAFFGLDPAEAEDLAAMAFNSDKKALRERAASLSPGERESVLRLLAHRTVEGSFGLEGANMASSLLALANDYLEGPGVAADDVARALAAQQAKRSLSDDDMPGALKVGLLSKSRDAGALVAAVLGSGRNRLCADITAAILSNARLLLEAGHQKAVADSFPWGVVQDVDASVLAGCLPAADLLSVSSEAIEELTEVLTCIEDGSYGTSTVEAVSGQDEQLYERLVEVADALYATDPVLTEHLYVAMAATAAERLIEIVYEDL